MAILSKGTTYADGDQITSTNLNALVDSATFAAGAVESGGGLQLNGSGQLKVAGNIDIGTSNLTATGSISLGATTFNDNNITNVGSIAVDTIIADNTDVTIDAAGDITLDAGGADIRLKDDGTQFGRLANSSSNLVVASSVSDKDILFQGSDGGSTITALTLDMSAAGAATFNDKITAVGTSVFTNLDISGDVDVDGTLETDALSIASTAVTATAAELNYNDTGASVGTVVASKTVTVDSNKDVSSFRNITLTGELDAGTLDISGDVDFGGIVTISDTTPIIRTSSNSEDLTLRGGNTDAGGQIKLNGSTASSANKIFYYANEHEFWNTGVTTKIEFQDDEIYFGSAGDVKLYRSGADALKTDDSFEVAGNLTLTGNGDFNGDLDVDGTTNLDAVDIDGAVDMASTLAVAGDANFDSGTLFVDVSENRVGIGTSSPGSELEVKGNGAEVFINSSDSAFSRVSHKHNGTSIWTTGTRSASDYHIFRESGSGNVIIDNGTLSCTLADGVTATTQSNGDNSTKVATTAYVDAATGGGEGGAFTTLTASGDVNFDSGTFFTDVSENRVGILNTSPSVALDVTGELNLSSHATLGSNLSLKKDTDAWSTDTWINVSDYGVLNTGGSFALTLNGNGYRGTAGWTSFGKGSEDGATQIWQYPAGYITFNANNNWGTTTDGSNKTVTERMRIDGSTGNVGINDSTPGYKLDVNGDGRFVNDLTLDEDLVHNRTGAGAFPGYSAGTFGAILEDGGSNGSTLYMSRKNSWVLYLATDTTLNGQSDKVVVFSDLNGQSGDADNIVGDITITSSSTAFNTSSDYRLKENEVDITDGIDRLKQLKPYRFNFKRDVDTTVDGFFAHEVSDIVPESITGTKDAMKDQEYEVSPAVYEDVVHPAVEATYDEDGQEITPAQEEWTESVLVTEAVKDTRSVPDYQGIDQSKLVPLLTAALQEAVAKIEALEARVQTLEG
tara:strand:+ start:3894 stop:6776 length:2883 start_codon:yes stop_codon:yes gene_type:complete